MPSEGGHATYLVIVPILRILTYIFIVNIYSLTYSHLQSQTPDVTIPTSNVPSHKLCKLNAKKKKSTDFKLARHKRTLCALVNTVMNL